MNAQVLPLSRNIENWNRSAQALKTVYRQDEKEIMLAPVRDLAYEIARAGNFRFSGEREWKEGKKTFFFLKNMQEGLRINGESVREYLLLVASHESSGKSYLASFHFSEGRGNRYTEKIAPLFIHPGGAEERKQNAIRIIRQYESARIDLYSKLNRFDVLVASDEICEEIRYRVVEVLQKNFLKHKTYSGKGIISQINAFDNLMSIERKGRKHSFYTLLNAATAFSTYHLDGAEPANAEGCGQEICKQVMAVLNREFEFEMAEAQA